ncbi:hypothetical protein [Thiocystis violacea]|uniref:hypothetical protein n=1 Tax=Thiocystis violacea TaxID=13725 RepID=UPI00190397A6|nr:hypothetical protein [Thiocystis violacea]MBK1720499.1 hypothetical protein [Thiocystis violacea]
MTLIEKARAQADTAHERLRDALLAGVDTSEARRALVAAEARLVELTRTAAPIGPDPEIERAIQTEAETLATETAEAIGTRQRLLAVSPT